MYVVHIYVNYQQKIGKIFKDENHGTQRQFSGVCGQMA